VLVFMFFYMFTCLYFIVCYCLGLLCTSCTIFIINKADAMLSADAIKRSIKSGSHLPFYSFRE